MAVQVKAQKRDEMSAESSQGIEPLKGVEAEKKCQVNMLKWVEQPVGVLVEMKELRGVEVAAEALMECKVAVWNRSTAYEF